MSTWADRPGTKPGNDKAVKLQKGIAMGVAAPDAKRVVRVPGLKVAVPLAAEALPRDLVPPDGPQIGRAHV